MALSPSEAVRFDSFSTGSEHPPVLNKLLFNSGFCVLLEPHTTLSIMAVQFQDFIQKIATRLDATILATIKQIEWQHLNKIVIRGSIKNSYINH